MTDFELVKKKDYYTLWKKYEALIMIYFKKLPENVRNYLFEDFADFKDSCYQVVVNAVDALTLSKIKNMDTWTFWQQLSFYLQNYTTRQCVRDTYKIWNNERLDNGIIPEDANRDKVTYDHNEYNLLMSSFTEEERNIVCARLENVAWYVLYKKYGKKYVESIRSSIKEKITNYIGD